MARRSSTRSFHSEEYGDLARVLIDARHAAGVSQRELALRLQVDPSYVAKYETRVRRLDVIEFLRICQALNAEPTELIKSLQQMLLRDEAGS